MCPLQVTCPAWRNLHCANQVSCQIVCKESLHIPSATQTWGGIDLHEEDVSHLNMGTRLPAEPPKTVNLSMVGGDNRPNYLKSTCSQQAADNLSIEPIESIERRIQRIKSSKLFVMHFGLSKF